VARAKRTARAEARRRHRAESAADTTEAFEGEASEEVPAEPAPVKARPGRTPARDPMRGGPERPPPAGGIRNAFRLAFRPMNLREDLALLPRLLVHRAFWLPMLLSTATAGAIIAFQGRELISQFAMTYFVYPPPIGAIFLAGFLAPRASYLLGAVIGIVTSVLFGLVVASVPVLFAGATFVDGLVSGLATSPVSGILFASAAAWYRRFLYLASPARHVDRRGAAARGKPARGSRSR